MPESLIQFINRMEAEKKLREEKGIETRKPVGNCTECGRPLHESPISADDTPDADLDPLRIGAP